MLMSIKNLQIPQVDQPTMSHFSAAAQMLSKLFSEVTRLYARELSFLLSPLLITSIKESNNYQV